MKTTHIAHTQEELLLTVDDVAESVRRYYSSIDDNDVSTVLELFAETAEYARPGYQTLNGRSEISEFYGQTRVIDSGKHTITEMVATAERAAVHGTFEGTLRNGENVSLRFADFFVFDIKGKFSRRDTFFFAPMV